MKPVEAKRHQPGRPRQPIKKETRITIRFSTAEFFIVREKAAKALLKPSVYLRQLGVQGKVTPRLSAEEREWIRQIVGISGNINQIAKACHQEGALKAPCGSILNPSGIRSKTLPAQLPGRWQELVLPVRHIRFATGIDQTIL